MASKDRGIDCRKSSQCTFTNIPHNSHENKKQFEVVSFHVVLVLAYLLNFQLQLSKNGLTITFVLPDIELFYHENEYFAKVFNFPVKYE